MENDRTREATKMKRVRNERIYNFRRAMDGRTTVDGVVFLRLRARCVSVVRRAKGGFVSLAGFS